MHDSCAKWICKKVREFALQNKSLLEVGSLNVNGSIREYFNGEYIGVDRQAGKGVDIVCNAHSLPFSNEGYEVVVSTEMLEHDEMFWLSIKEMARVLKHGGYLILTARGNGFPEHSFPSDYYRFMPESFRILFELADCAIIEIVSDPDPLSPGMFGIGKKR